VLLDEYVEDGVCHQIKHYVYRDGCYWDLVDSNVWQLIDMYGHYRNGYLWFDTLISHNPAWYVDAMRYLDIKLKSPKLDL